MRRTGVIVWQSIASDIRREIETGTFPSGKRLPNEQALAERYGVNRHTAAFCLSMIFSENRYPLFRIML